MNGYRKAEWDEAVKTWGIIVSDTAGCCCGIIVGIRRHKQFKEIILIAQGGFEYISDSNSGQMRRVFTLEDMTHIFLTQPTLLRLL